MPVEAADKLLFLCLILTEKCFSYGIVLLCSAPSISKSFLERWKSRDPDDEDAPLLNYLINEAAGDDASLRWADEVIETLNGEEAA